MGFFFASIKGGTLVLAPVVTTTDNIPSSALQSHGSSTYTTTFVPDTTSFFPLVFLRCSQGFLAG